MRKLLSIGFAACIALLALGAATASAADTQNYTFTGQSSGDSGTCGPDWANDTYTRVFKIYPERNLDGSYRMVESFTSGHFTTIQGPSPESCEAGTLNSISAGLHGSFHGSEVIKVTGSGITYSAAGAAAWNGTGGTLGFTVAAFGVNAADNVSDFYFKYKTANSLACSNKWINSATGNSGDIATFCP
jgi:phospholipase/lecithinase/hemolysin